MKLGIKRGDKGTPKRPKLVARDGLIFLIGILMRVLRVNDLGRLKVRDVKDKMIFDIREGKTNKQREINIGMLQAEIQRFITNKHPDDYLFVSQKGSKPISTTQVYRILNDAADFLGLGDIGTHTMRKTFGYHHYKQFKNVAILQETFNPSAPSITKRYVGIEQDEINTSLNQFGFE